MTKKTLEQNDLTEQVELAKLYVGKDSGNISTKITFINNSGELEDCLIPTVIAPAPETALVYNTHKSGSKNVALEDLLHVRVNSPSLNDNEQNRTWYVGKTAMKQKNKLQPVVENGSAETKFSDTNRKLFALPLITGIAVAAAKNGLTQVDVPLSMGIPNEAYMKSGQALKKNFVGLHTVTFVDGEHKDQTITINIAEDTAQIHAEAVTTALALRFDIKKNDIVENPIFDGISDDESYIVADLGAGTNDFSVFNGYDLDKHYTARIAEYAGEATNTYIDKIMHDALNVEAFSELKESVGDEESNLPQSFSSREAFMEEVVKPVVDKVIKGDVAKADVKFTMDWAYKKKVDITEIVINHMTDYAESVKKSLKLAYAVANTDRAFVVGGGVVFGYLGGLDTLDKIGVTIADKEASAYFTSRSYAIAAFLSDATAE